MKILEPLRIHPPSARRALVVRLAASEPAPGSVRAKAPSLRPDASSGSQRSFWASLPKARIGATPTEVCTSIMTAVLAQARATSSTRTAKASWPISAPP